MNESIERVDIENFIIEEKNTAEVVDYLNTRPLHASIAINSLEKQMDKSIPCIIDSFTGKIAACSVFVDKPSCLSGSWLFASDFESAEALVYQIPFDTKSRLLFPPWIGKILKDMLSSNSIHPIILHTRTEPTFEKAIPTVVKLESKNLKDVVIPNEFKQVINPKTLGIGNVFCGIIRDGMLMSYANMTLETEDVGLIENTETIKSSRGQGYARACLLELSKRIMQKGKTPMFFLRQENQECMNLARRTGFIGHSMIHMAEPK
ncbi:MAG TPA: GNAT family N-acetyltransferase [Caldisericia bacterium]|nr:GNAT family N-acetyltransferase [Caldisericia bacterium]HPF49207.1 GNAT family N-acetyltransferase [Caldisericia bacterium]HPI84114.1 GNAT family N-acetyltransferase [Caldisericia bacterium]HPQ93371.1 GNAT family N-acetyltransferase [Caldisericia bacterium]HRV75247.1 GNAT family N-acetyltransferase [Caldisericia bacterium]